jgi:HAMP domain-containing protein
MAIAGIAILSVFQVVLMFYYLHEINLSADAIEQASRIVAEEGESPALRQRAINAIDSERGYMAKVLGHANRNLVTLLFLTLIYLAVLLVVLPRRIFDPIRRLARLIRRAEASQLVAYAQSGSSDEISELAENLHHTLERMRRFDSEKREQIVQDQAKVNRLIQAIEQPTAIVTRDYYVDVANDAFVAFLGLETLDTEVQFPQLFSQGGGALKQLFDGVMNHRQEVNERPIQLTGPKGDYAAQVSISAIRGRGGPANFALVSFQTLQVVSIQSE